MNLFSLHAMLTRLVRLARSNRRPASVAGRLRSRLTLEVLEGRCLPSTVTNLADNGPGSLRDAIAITPAGGLVDFQPGLTGTITLTSGELVINNNLTITGPGSSSLAISGNNTSPVFCMALATSNVNLSGLTIANGSSTGAGGGILNLGTLSITNCTISGNFASSVGGGIENWGPLTITGSVLSNNSTTAGSGSGGGAIYNEGVTLNIANSTFSGNTSEQGGGIINNSGTLVVHGSTFSQNHGGAGGGIFNVFASATATITNSTFDGNFADTAAGYAGGGIANSGGKMTVIGCTLSGNSAGTWTIPGEGAGIYNQDGNLTVSDSTLYGNSASQGGGIAVVNSPAAPETTIENCTLYLNSATLGGGVANFGGTLSTRDTIIAGNTAPGSNDVYGSLASQGHNLIGVGDGGSGYTPTDLVGTLTTPIDPQLGPLQNNGGPTQTLALLPGSPAIAAGDITGAPKWDQRGLGYYRVVNGLIDIGAFEVQTAAGIASTPKVTMSGGTFTYGGPGATHAASATAVGADGKTPVAGTFTFTYNGSSVLPEAADTYAVVASFTSSDPNFANATGTATIVINPASPLLTVTAGTFAYDGTPHAATVTAAGVDGVTPVSGTLAITYNGSTTAPSATGTYAVVATFTSNDPNYGNAIGTGTITIGTSQAMLTATGVNVKATAGAPFSGTLATFTNAEPEGTAVTYSAVIAWGDGSTSAGVVSGTGTTLTVSGSHTYADPGTDTIQVTITDTLVGFAAASTTSTAPLTSLKQEARATRNILFWHRATGQALILAFNGGSTHTELATWLATYFPNLYGTGAGAHDLTGKANTDVAALYRALWKANKDGADVQVVATALDVYATTTSLGGAQGKNSGFRVSPTGHGAERFFVGNYGAAVGVANNTRLNVFEMLRAVNNQAVNGVLYNGNTQVQNLATVLFDELNTI